MTDLEAIRDGNILRDANKSGGLCGKKDYCPRANNQPFLKHETDPDRIRKFKQQECRLCFLERKKDPDKAQHIPRRLTGIYIWIMDLSGELRTLVDDLYQLGAIDETDVLLIHQARRFMRA